MKNPDLYQLLGVERTASEDALKRAYRQLAKKHHPDRNPDDPSAEERFKEVSAAYAILSDKEKRASYDQWGHAGPPRANPNPRGGSYRQSQHFNFEDFMNDVNFGGAGGAGGAGAPFDLNDLFGGQGRRAGGMGKRRGQDLNGEVRVLFVESVTGCERELQVGPKTVRVRIPAGVKDGSKIRVRGKGGAGQNGGPRGDILLTVKVEKHPWFYYAEKNEKSPNLHLRLPVTIVEAYMGAKINVPTPHGEVQLSIPAGSQHGQKLRIRGKGIQKSQSATDLIVHLDIRLPPKGIQQVEEAFQSIKDTYSESVRNDIHL